MSAHRYRTNTTQYLLSSVFSILLCLFIMSTYLRNKNFRRHPSPIIFGRSISHLFLAIVLLIWKLLDIASNHNDNICIYIATSSIIFYYASAFYFIGICYDLLISFLFPLYPNSETVRRVHMLTWSLSIACGSVGYWTSINSDPKSCIFHDGNSFIIWSLTGVYSFGILVGLLSSFFGLSKISGGLADTMELRKRIITEHAVFSLGYCLMGIGFLLAFFIVSNAEAYESQFSNVLGVLLLGNPLLDAVMWCYFKYIPERQYKKEKKRLQKAQKTQDSSKYQPLPDEQETIREERDSDIERELAMVDLTDSYTIPKNRKRRYPKKDISGLHGDGSESLLAEIAEDQQLRKAQEQSEKTISDALRKEIVLYMINGIRQATVQARSGGTQKLEMIGSGHFPKSIGETYTQDSMTMSRFQVVLENKFGSTNPKSKGSLDVEFTDYAPHVFRAMRTEIYEVTDEEYLQSIQLDDTNDWLAQCNFSEGKSGAFFFLTPDSKYFIKSLREFDEAPTFARILPSYVEHFKTYQSSLINKYFGFHRIHIHGTKLYFVVMNNIFVPGYTPHERYDLKGSFVRRVTRHHTEIGKVMKDRDFHKNVLLPEDVSIKVWNQLKADTKYLEQSQVMDYSLMLGIYNVGLESSHIYSSDWVFAPLYDSFKTNKYQGYQAPKLQTASRLRLDPKPAPARSNSVIPLQTAATDSLHPALAPMLKPASDLKLKDLGTPQVRHHSQLTEEFEDEQTFRQVKTAAKGKDTKKRADALRQGNEDMRVVQDHKSTMKAELIEGPGFYCIGIIDILQHWNYFKRFERFYKVHLFCDDGDGLSCMEPTMYRKRFLAKMLEVGFGPHKKGNFKDKDKDKDKDTEESKNHVALSINNDNNIHTRTLPTLPNDKTPSEESS